MYVLSFNPIVQSRSQIFIELFHHAISFPLGTLGGQGIKVVKFLERLPNQINIQKCLSCFFWQFQNILFDVSDFTLNYQQHTYTANVYRDLQGLCGEIGVQGFQNCRVYMYVCIQHKQCRCAVYGFCGDFPVTFKVRTCNAYLSFFMHYLHVYPK